MSSSFSTSGSLGEDWEVDGEGWQEDGEGWQEDAAGEDGLDDKGDVDLEAERTDEWCSMFWLASLFNVTCRTFTASGIST